MPPSTTLATTLGLVAENAELRVKLAEAEDMLRAIRRGEIDALVMQSDTGPRVDTPQAADWASNRACGEMLEIISDAVIAVDVDRRVTYVNPAAQQLFSLDASVALGKPTSEIPQLRLPNELIDENSTSNGKWHGEVVDRGRESATRCLEATLMVRQEDRARQEDCDGSARILATFRDISDRKRAEDELRRSEQLHRIAFDLAPAGIVYVALDTRFINVNARMSEITGYAADELLCMKGGDLTHPDDLAHDKQLIHAFLSGATPDYEMEKRYVRKDGSSCWVAVSGRMVTDDAGQPLHTICTIRDIQQRKTAEASLRTSEIRYRRLFEAAHDGVLILDPDTRKIIDANPFMTTLLGYPQA